MLADRFRMFALLWLLSKKAPSEWHTADTVELSFFLTLIHHNTGLLFQHIIFVDALLITVIRLHSAQATVHDPLQRVAMLPACGWEWLVSSLCCYCGTDNNIFVLTCLNTNAGKLQQRHARVSAHNRAPSRHLNSLPTAHCQPDVLLCSSTS